jgi:hypothetical protein
MGHPEHPFWSSCTTECVPNEQARHFNTGHSFVHLGHSRHPFLSSCGIGTAPIGHVTHFNSGQSREWHSGQIEQPFSSIWGVDIAPGGHSLHFNEEHSMGNGLIEIGWQSGHCGQPFASTFAFTLLASNLHGIQKISGQWYGNGILWFSLLLFPQSGNAAMMQFYIKKPLSGIIGKFLIELQFPYLLVCWKLL